MGSVPDLGQDRVEDGVGTQVVYGDGQMRLAVERETALVAMVEIGAVGEDGAGGLAAAAAEQDGFEGDLKVNEPGSGCLEEELEGTRIFYGPAAEGEDEVLPGGLAGDGPVLKLAEPGFAAGGEDLGDGLAFGRFNDGVDVDEAPAEMASEQAADGAFAGAHEAGQDDSFWPTGELLEWQGGGWLCCNRGLGGCGMRFGMGCYGLRG